MIRVIDAELRCMDHAAQLHDVTFARTVLFVIAGILASIGFQSNVGAYAFAALTALVAVYYQLVEIPNKSHALYASRLEFGAALSELVNR